MDSLLLPLVIGVVVVVVGELLIGAALILGAFTGIAAFLVGVEPTCLFGPRILRTPNVHSVIPCRGLPQMIKFLTLPRVSRSFDFP